MQERTLFFIALGTSFLGILGLFSLSYFIDYELFAIQDITPERIGETVRIEGEITSLSFFQERYLLEVQDETGSIPVVFYSSESISIKKNSFVEVIGIVSDYECTLQMTAEKINLLFF